MADLNVTPTYEMNKAGTTGDMTGMAGGNWIWIILLFLLFGRGGFGGFGSEGIQTATGLTNEALLIQLNNNLNAGFNSINTNLCNGFATINSGIAGVNLALATGFGSITHQNDMNTCAIKSAIHEDGAATRALINSIELQNWRDRAMAAENALSNSQQTAQIVNSLRPYPAPAYLAPNPLAPNGYREFGY